MGGGAGLSVAVAVVMMMVGTSHCLMSSSSAGNSSTAASSAWCDGHMIDGRCMLIAHAYGAGEHFEYLEMDGMDMMVEAESIRRGLAAGHKGPVTFDSLKKNQGFGPG
ncbi:hypothetical protein T07_5763, partial [Trichinella nelsoni]